MISMTTSSYVNMSLIGLFGDGQHAAAHAAKPHHVAGYGTSGGLAATFVILNGYSFALITLLCFILNFITIPIMLQRDIIIPSYIVLTAITLSDMFMALSSLPFNVYFYLFDAYKSFVPFDLCFAQRTFGEVVPAALHTMSIWCTVYLAVHRYREVTTTTTTKRKMSISGGSASRGDFITVCLHIALVAFFSFFIQCFRFFDTEIIPVRVVAPKDLTLSLMNTTVSPPVISCSMRLKTFITSTIGKKPYFLTFLWSRTICVQILPCAILIFVNTLLIRILNERIEVRKHMMQKAPSSPRSTGAAQPLINANNNNNSTLLGQGNNNGPLAYNISLQSTASRDSNSGRANLALRNWRLITRMLWLIVLITLIVELPFAVWFIYLCVDITAFQFGLPSYVVNVVSSTLNVLLLLTTPLKFVIYFTMIRPFRDKLQEIQRNLTLRFFKHANNSRLNSNNDGSSVIQGGAKQTTTGATFERTSGILIARQQSEISSEQNNNFQNSSNLMAEIHQMNEMNREPARATAIIDNSLCLITKPAPFSSSSVEISNQLGINSTSKNHSKMAADKFHKSASGDMSIVSPAMLDKETQLSLLIISREPKNNENATTSNLDASMTTSMAWVDSGELV